jgi:hypothetical protein
MTLRAMRTTMPRPIECPACSRVHLVNPATGKVLGALTNNLFDARSAAIAKLPELLIGPQS